MSTASMNAHMQQVVRCERYFGLRASDDNSPLSPASASIKTTIPPHTRDEHVVFLSIDFESVQVNGRCIITEVGFASLDTEEVATTVPGDYGNEYFNKFDTWHFLVGSETRGAPKYKDFRPCHPYINFYVDESRSHIKYQPDPRAFQNAGLGETVCIKLGDLKTEVDEVFKYCRNLGKGDRKIVLVVHAGENEAAYFRLMGSNIHGYPGIIDTIDTQHLWRAIKDVSDPKNLGRMSWELGLIPETAYDSHVRLFHNAGGDAYYTLRCMIAMTFKGVKPSSETVISDK